MSAPRWADFIGSITKFSHLWFVFNTIFFQGFVAVTEKILEKPFCKHGKHSDQLGHRLSDKQQRIDGKGDSCPAEILCVTFYKFSFLTILKFWFSFFSQGSISYMNKMFSWWTKSVLLVIVLVNFIVPSDCSTSSAGWWSSWWTEVFSCWTFACDFFFLQIHL